MLDLRRRQRRCAAAIANEVNLAASTVQKILNSEGTGRLNAGDQATQAPPLRYVHDAPGDLVHVDIKKLVTIPNHPKPSNTVQPTAQPTKFRWPGKAKVSLSQPVWMENL